MARKSMWEMDWASSEFDRASSKKLNSFAKKNAKKMLHSGGKKSSSSRKSKQADADATVLLIGLAAAALLYQGAANIVEKAKGK